MVSLNGVTLPLIKIYCRCQFGKEGQQLSKLSTSSLVSDRVKGLFADSFHKMHENLQRIFLMRKWTISMQHSDPEFEKVLYFPHYWFLLKKKKFIIKQTWSYALHCKRNYQMVDLSETQMFQILKWYNNEDLNAQRKEFRIIFSNHSTKVQVLMLFSHQLFAPIWLQSHLF